ncbi:MAG: threonine-phosphate decarboxylase [Litoreibacter sp.]|uniref:threonine-phosphate decarboxylase n=1 Tax=Litoreibacter sp. TaxID=1969459 RepID=UPI003297C3AC
MSSTPRDHGGGLDAAIAKYGGQRADWLDLSTGINPVPYPIGEIDAEAWTALPDSGAFERLANAARKHWGVPEGAEIVPAQGASALIAAMPHVFNGRSVVIPTPTYNEHAAAFRAQGYDIAGAGAGLRVVIHPNNPDGRLWSTSEVSGPIVIDESFCDIAPADSHIQLAERPDTVVLKSFGKFWGLAGMRLGFAITTPKIAQKLRNEIGPWAVSGPALQIGARALEDHAWADTTRDRLAQDAERLDAVMLKAGAKIVGGTTLFRLYDVNDAAHWQDKLAKGHVWSRIFPYSDRWLRLGLPAPDRWDQLEAAL